MGNAKKSKKAVKSKKVVLKDMNVPKAKDVKGGHFNAGAGDIVEVAFDTGVENQPSLPGDSVKSFNFQGGRAKTSD